MRGVVPGGDSAHASIVSGLREAVADGQPNDAVVLVHDGVRPIISDELIDRNSASVLRYGSAITAIPAFETVVEACTGSMVVQQVPERSKMQVLRAPRSFRLGHICAVNAVAADGSIVVGSAPARPSLAGTEPGWSRLSRNDPARIR